MRNALRFRAIAPPGVRVFLAPPRGTEYIIEGVDPSWEDAISGDDVWTGPVIAEFFGLAFGERVVRIDGALAIA